MQQILQQLKAREIRANLELVLGAPLTLDLADHRPPGPRRQSADERRAAFDAEMAATFRTFSNDGGLQ